MIEFLKMHGLGNDFIILDARDGNPFVMSKAAARALTDRRRGIGCDQLLIIRHSDQADIAMDILNTDGSPSGACGNGTRCVADYVMQKSGQKSLTIATDGGLLSAHYDNRFGDNLIAVDMGPAYLNWQDVPLANMPASTPANMPANTATNTATDANSEAGGTANTLAVDLGHGLPPVVCHSMGNPHAVAFVDDVAAIDLETLGPLIETHPLFPERVNFSIVAKQADGVFRMRVWERGVGITMACGSGACAVGVAAHRRALNGRKAEIIMDGGSVHIDWIDDGSTGGRVMLIGPVAYSYSGVLAPELEAMMTAGSSAEMAES